MTIIVCVCACVFCVTASAIGENRRVLVLDKRATRETGRKNSIYRYRVSPIRHFRAYYQPFIIGRSQVSNGSNQQPYSSIEIFIKRSLADVETEIVLPRFVKFLRA